MMLGAQPTSQFSGERIEITSAPKELDSAQKGVGGGGGGPVEGRTWHNNRGPLEQRRQRSAEHHWERVVVVGKSEVRRREIGERDVTDAK
jgi:hypothetical protein